MHPDVVLIVLDTARADVFEPYGATAGSSPTVAQLASSGAAAQQMYAPSGWTLPSHAGLFTGLEPRTAGLARAPGRSPVGCRPVMERHLDRLLPEVLRRAGYLTAAASCNAWIGEASGFDLGFDRFEELRGSRSTSMARPGRRAAARWAWSALRCTEDDGANQAIGALERAIDAAADRPLFWFANVVECHSPYLPPRPFTDVGPLRRVGAARVARRRYSMIETWKSCLGPLRLDDDELDLMRHLYQRSILQLDDWLAHVLDVLEARGRLDRSLVVVTSDHGENFGEQGLIGHSFSLDQRLVRVPFVAAGPGAPELDGVASLLEVPRLLAEAIGLDEHPWQEARLDEGVAVAQFDAPADRNDATLAIARGWDLDEAGIDLLFAAQTAVTDGRYKLRRVGGADHLIDLDADPSETDPLPARDAPPHLVRALERAATPVVPPVAATEIGTISDDLEERLRLLGYM